MTRGPLHELLSVLSLVAGESWSLPTHASAQLACLPDRGRRGRGLCAGILFVITQGSASASSCVTVFFPLVTTVEGVLLAREPINPAVAGALLVTAGVYFGSIRRNQRPVPAPVRVSA